MILLLLSEINCKIKFYLSYILKKIKEINFKLN